MALGLSVGESVKGNDLVFAFFCDCTFLVRRRYQPMPSMNFQSDPRGFVCNMSFSSRMMLKCECNDEGNRKISVVKRAARSNGNWVGLKGSRIEREELVFELSSSFPPHVVVVVRKRRRCG